MMMMMMMIMDVVTLIIPLLLIPLWFLLNWPTMPEILPGIVEDNLNSIKVGYPSNCQQLSKNALTSEAVNAQCKTTLKQ